MNSDSAKGKKSWGLPGKTVAQLLGSMLTVLLLCMPAFSQGSFGRILGTVSDQSGGIIAGATVTVIDTERGVIRTLTTDDAGVYNAPNLTPGNYTVRAGAAGFKKLERQNVVIEVGREVRVDFTVQPGEQNQTVTVTESVPLVETTNATMGGTLENADIVDLPLNGRDYQNLLGLRPGVMLMVGGGPWTQSTNGVRPDESVWMIEGVFNANPFDARPVIGMPSPFTDGATILPVDAIQEFNVMENPKAEYGWKAGAVVNVGIKSGTNQLHGSAYAFGRYDGWDARNFYNVAPFSNGNCAIGLPITCAKVPAQLKQFGGVVGGPIKKDKLFFFGGYEGLRSFIAPAAGISAPQTNATGNNNNCLTTNGCDSVVDAINLVGPANASKVSEALLCPNAIGQSGASLPAGFVCTGSLWQVSQPGTTGVISNFPITNTSDNGIGKLDWHPNDKNAINGVFFLGNYSAVGEDHAFVGLPFNDTVPIKTWTATASWVYTPNSNTVNELRFGLSRTTFNFVNIDVNKPSNGTSAGYPINTGVTDPLVGGLPNINIGGFSTGLGTASNRPQYFTPNPFYDVQDSISVLKGKHSIKFGGEVAHMEADINVYNVGRGLFNFPTLQAFFQGAPATGQILAGKPAVKNTWMMYSGYVQDDWRVTPKLIINLGLRYEYVTPLKEATNLWGSFDPASATGMVQQGQAGYSTIWKADPRDFSPRLGIAWDVTGNGTTVVRGGASIIYSSFVGEDFQGAFGLENDTATALGSDPTGASIFCGGGAALGESSCPTSGGGTIKVGSVNFTPGQLCWDPALATCPAGQTTVFPSVAAKCGDGVGFVSPGVATPGPCDLMAVDPNLKLPMILNYNLSIQHQFGSNLSLQVAYVGNRGYRLLNFADINQAPLGASYCLNSLTPAQKAGACAGGPLTAGNSSLTALQEARPYFTKFPYIGFINDVSNRSHSNYNSLQVTLTQRASHGLSFTAGYTYGHGLDNGSLNRFGGLPQDSNNLAAEYASGDLDARHRLSVTATYDIPGIKGFGQLLEGWQINAIVSYQSPLPWMAADGIKPGPPGNNFDGTGEQTDRWNISGPASSFSSGKSSIPFCIGGNCTVATAYGPITTLETAAQSAGCGAAADLSTLAIGGCYASVDGKAFLTPNALGQYGDMGRNIFRDSGFKNLDMSVFKNFKFKERYGIQARWEVFNAFNRPLAANPYGAGGFVNANNLLNAAPFGSALATPDFIAGNPLIGSGSQRVMQVGLKLTF
jgi:Carboxypeptidase regulatory-like domain/TonB dependent receptor